MKVIFLDIDGVLNSSSFFNRIFTEEGHCFVNNLLDQNALLNLKDLLWQTGAYIVISSTWRFDIDTLKKQFAPYGITIAGTTQIENIASNDFAISRSSEIQNFLETRPCFNSYVIIDDLNKMFFSEQQQCHLVSTDPKIGLTKQDVQKAIEILNKTE